jgi:hypothetical protein
MQRRCWRWVECRGREILRGKMEIEIGVDYKGLSSYVLVSLILL